MRIISKHKDYYDYLSDIYGRDNLVILNRRPAYKMTTDKRISQFKYRKVAVAICDTIYYGAQSDTGKYYWGEELFKIGKKPKYTWSKYEVIEIILNDKVKSSFRYLPEKTDVNLRFGLPVMVSYDNYEFRNPAHKGSAILKHSGIPAWYPAKKIYIDTYTWLSNQKEEKDQDNQTDKEKIIGHGFDLKKSFRHRK